MGHTERYRIGFLNPWKNAAENQAYHSMSIAASRIGHSMVHVSTTHEILAAGLDFVIATATTQPKTTDVPTFGSIHEPRERFWENPAYFDNLLTYDGYLTISDTLERFLRSISAGFGRECVIGRYYNTPQKSDLTCNISEIASRGALQLCYFGTNWDKRGRTMFRALSTRDYMRIYGPEASWSYLNGTSYKGTLPFDGMSVQREYSLHGAGLVSLSQGHLEDDIISNRIFEIASAGAVAICPDTPWIRDRFGDSVYYYDPHGSKALAISGIDHAMSVIARHPDIAASKAAKARGVFESRFCAEVMLRNAISAFEEWSAAKARKRATVQAEPKIDVIIRCGGRPAHILRRAVQSIDDQTAGRFRVIFVCYKSIDLSEFQSRDWRRIDETVVLERFQGNRSVTLCAGLKAVRSDYFAVLDDDDYWLSSHIEALLDSAALHDISKTYAYSGTIAFEQHSGDATGETHTLHNARPGVGDIWRIMGSFAMNSFLCSSSLLKQLSLTDWRLETAEDSVLQATMIAHADVSFSYRATACFQRNSADNSDFARSARRAEDEFECFARIASLVPAIERKFAQTGLGPWERVGWALDRIKARRKEATMQNITTIVYKEGQASDSLHEIAGINPIEISLAALDIMTAGQSQKIEGPRAEISVFPGQQAWAYGVQINLRNVNGLEESGWLVAEFSPTDVSFGIGILNSEGAFEVREECFAAPLPLEVWIRFEPAKSERLVVQNWTNPLTSPVTLKRLFYVSDAQALNM